MVSSVKVKLTVSFPATSRQENTPSPVCHSKTQLTLQRTLKFTLQGFLCVVIAALEVAL